tara:strand:+ start:1585 stop:1902 length:318 start_codon:yes stop_codon:yes gene_type:complete
MKINTIDDRIRKDARDTFRVELDTAKKALYKSLGLLGTMNRVEITSRKDSNDLLTSFAYDKDLIITIFEAAFERQKVGREEKAVSEFMTKVNSLQEQIDDLQYRD